MKSRFSSLDIAAVVKELQKYLGMRIVNVYDIDNKTYLIKLAKPDHKVVLLLESGIRFHSTEFEWPKNAAPSGFSMKMRKHLKGRRLECLNQLGMDRIIDLQFGSDHAAYHVIIELYDRGNIILTDCDYVILNLLRPRTDQSQDVRFAVQETYVLNIAKPHQLPTREKLTEMLSSCKEGDVLKKILVSNLDYGPALIEHCLKEKELIENSVIGKGFNMETDMDKLLKSMEMAEDILQTIVSTESEGFITQRKDKKPNPKEGEDEHLLTFEAFHPYMFCQDSLKSIMTFPCFDRAVDYFFSQLEGQRLDMKSLQQEKSAMKKLDNVKKDHEKRLAELQREQETDIFKGQLIEMNLSLVDQAILIVRSAVANQIDWQEIWNLVKEAQLSGDAVAKAIKVLKLDINHVVLLLKDPYEANEDDDYPSVKSMKVDVDLSLSAYANSRKYFDRKRQAAKKEQKTMDASKKAYKSAEKKTKDTLKDMSTIASIKKARKTFWFEKFLWFVSSENFLVIGGRDMQQNEILVKRYLRQGDLYVHADLHGATSCIIKNTTGQPVPPKTLNEAGTMAICHSAAWDAKVVTSAWYVYHDQVSKTAPSGEYLTTGSFMIRGKKNYIPPSYLIYGFAFLFKLEEDSIARHKGERKVCSLGEDDKFSIATDNDKASEGTADVCIASSDDDDDDDKTCDDVNNTDRNNSDSNDENNAATDSKDVDTDSNDENTAATDSKDVDTDSNDDSISTTDSKNVCADENNSDGNNVDENDVCADETVCEDKSDVDKENCHNDKSNVGDDKDNDKKNVNSNTDGSVAFPDTSINLQHVKGDKYELTRSVSTVSDTESNVFYLGDDQPVTIGNKNLQAGSRISAKQRRDMKKARKDGNKIPQEPHSEKIPQKTEEVKIPKKQKVEQVASIPQVLRKRGQKAKLKKIKEKYGYQDDEERQLRMEILASAGTNKEEKSKSKDKKGKQNLQKGQTQGPRPQSGKPWVKDQSKSTEVTASNTDKDAPQKSAKVTHVEVVEEDEEEKELSQQAENVQILDSLSGQPVTEDELLFAVPICAPYNSLINYKYKVKLTPGNTKKGKAVKAAINVFLHDKLSTSREKDLIRLLKDVDLARNMPGKVKVSAPHLHRKK